MVRSRQIERAKGLPFEYGYLYAVPAEAETKDENAKSLSVVNPSNFPVSYSPFPAIYGKITAGATYADMVNNRVYALRRIYIPGPTNIVEIYLYLAAMTTSHTEYFAIYSDSSGSPNALLGEDSWTGTGTSAAWHRRVFSTPIPVSAGYYWIAYAGDNAVSCGKVYYDSETNASYYNGSISAGHFPASFGTPTALNNGYSAYVRTSGSTETGIYGSIAGGQSFPAIAGTCRGVLVRIKRVGTPTGSFQAELLSTSFAGTVLASGYLNVADIGTDYETLLVIFSSAATLTASTTYYLRFRCANSAGDANNYYALGAGVNLVAGNVALSINGITWFDLTEEDLCFGVPMFVLEKHITQENITSVAYANIFGVNWFMESILPLRFCPFRRLTLYLKKIGTPAGPLYASLYAIDPATGKPTGQPLVTGSIAAASVSTTVGWLNIDFSWPMNYNTQYVIVLSSPLSVDAANCYMAGYVTSNPYAGGQYGASTDSGVTWTLTAANDFCFDVWVPTEQLIFDQNFSPTSPTDLTWAAAKVYLGLWTNLKSLDGQYMTLRVLVNSVEQTDAGTYYNGVNEKECLALNPEKSVPQISWNLKIYGAGDGVITALRYMRHHYCDAQTITPATFGVTELILHQGQIMVGSLVILNDDFKQRQYCPDNSKPKILDFTGSSLDIVVRKVYFAKGQSILSFEGR